MLNVLTRVEGILPLLMQERVAWRSVFVDYEHPFVERLWREWGEYRVYLHRIHPCAAGEALFHPHPWPSAMKVLSGSYQMAVGYGSGVPAPPVVATLMLCAGSRYEMVHPDGWHSVRPLEVPSLSLMVTGTPWRRWSPKSEGRLRALTTAEERMLFANVEHVL